MLGGNRCKQDGRRDSNSGLAEFAAQNSSDYGGVITAVLPQSGPSFRLESSGAQHCAFASWRRSGECRKKGPEVAPWCTRPTAHRAQAVPNLALLCH